VSGRIDQVELIVFPVVRLVIEPHGCHLDGDAALALNIHRVEQLLLHVSFLDGAGFFQESIREGRLAVVDMGDNTKVADMALRVCHLPFIIPRPLPLAADGAAVLGRPDFVAKA